MNTAPDQQTCLKSDFGSGSTLPNPKLNVDLGKNLNLTCGVIFARSDHLLGSTGNSTDL